MRMTPMAAALAARRDEIVQLLLDGGAKPHTPDPEGTP
jgi:ankyrin repeat protein